MLEAIILGTIQGITEWLPVSSEGIIVLIKTNFFGGGLIDAIAFSLFLHLGTTTAALIYFRKDIISLFKTLLRWREVEEVDKKLFSFLFITTLISGSLGFLILKILTLFESTLVLSMDIVNATVGVLLLVTAFLLYKGGSIKNEIRATEDLKNKDSFILGIVQSVAVLPGLSRSGLTVSALLLNRFNAKDALRLSFLMSIPIVIAGNIALNISSFTFNSSALLGFLSAFAFGLVTIHIFILFAQKINFSYFVFFIAVLMLTSIFI